MKYVGVKVTVHQYSNDWMMVDSVDDPRDSKREIDGKPKLSFKGRIISPSQLRDVSEEDVELLNEQSVNAGFFWEVYKYNAANRRFEPSRKHGRNW